MAEPLAMKPQPSTRAACSVRAFPRERCSDAELVAAIAAGDEEALVAIWKRHGQAVRATLYACLGPDPAIDDLVQEVFLTLYRRAERIENPAQVRSYLLGAAARSATFERRTRARKTRWLGLFERERAGSVSRPYDWEARDALRLLQEILERVPERPRLAFVLRYVDDLSPTDVAVALGISTSTAKRAIAKGRERVLYFARREPGLVEYAERLTEEPS